MQVLRDIKAVKKALNQERKSGNKIAFVPTMGALHNGHLTLIKKAKKHADIVVCSIFVNPTQFNNKEDLKKYPRTEENDCKLLESVDCNYAFVPDVKEVYPKNFKSPEVDLGELATVMEGANRPGHFEGVVEVVSRLFDIVEPDMAFFGKKDFQQLAIIRRMTSELNYDIDIKGVDIVRAKSGLALSSRNARLSENGREKAAFLYQTLREAAKKTGYHTPKYIKKWVTKQLDKQADFELEYFEIADTVALQPTDKWEKGKKYRGYIVAWLEGVRLIDNIALR